MNQKKLYKIEPYIINMLDEKTKEKQVDHRLTLRIPKFLLDKVDKKRKQRIGTISRNLWILEIIEKATKE